MEKMKIRDIMHVKGYPFSSKFIKQFDKEWKRTTNRLKRSGADLSIPLVKKAD